MRNSATPVRQSLVHGNWTKTMTVLAASHPEPAVRELAEFCSEVLDRCGDTHELTEYLNGRALKALDAT